jgi:hypothetical protein
MNRHGRYLAKQKRGVDRLLAAEPMYMLRQQSNHVFASMLIVESNCSLFQSRGDALKVLIVHSPV